MLFSLFLDCRFGLHSDHKTSSYLCLVFLGELTEPHITSCSVRFHLHINHTRSQNSPLSPENFVYRMQLLVTKLRTLPYSHILLLCKHWCFCQCVLVHDWNLKYSSVTPTQIPYVRKYPSIYSMRLCSCVCVLTSLLRVRAVHHYVWLRGSCGTLWHVCVYGFLLWKVNSNEHTWLFRRWFHTYKALSKQLMIYYIVYFQY